jgi:esterase/lipase superfamily enzyme
MKVRSGWHSERVGQHVQVVRWGHLGRPVLLFPTAGGDAEECERFLMLDALAPLLDAGRIKVYACDSVSGRAWIDGDKDGEFKGRMQTAFDGFIRHELVPAIRTDCRTPDIEIIAAGASIGAFNALSTLCRQPDVFRAAVCMSGTYDMSRWTGGRQGFDFHVSSPLHFLPNLADDSEQLRRLRTRFVLLATGEGRYEAPGESWQVANALGARGVPNRVDPWGTDWHHDWVTWRAMLPKYLDELTSGAT